MSIKENLEKLCEEKAPGPSPAFSVFHIIRALELIAERPTGRKQLATKLKAGEGTARTLINRLKENGLITISKAGCNLTEKGEDFWKNFKLIFPRKVKMEKNEFAINAFNIAILVKDCGHKVKAGLEQRDAAIRIGAKGVVTLVFQNKKLTMPTISENIAKDFPIANKQIIENLKPEENDAVVIGSADTLDKAEYGALAAALALQYDQ